MTYREVFKKPHVFLAVIHVLNIKQALRNVRIAIENGADGVFLIDHNRSYNELLFTYFRVRADFPSAWIGLNFLDLNRNQALQKLPNGANGLWVDDGGIYEGIANGKVTYRSSEAENFLKLRTASGWPGIYFGGVAFKGQSIVTNPAMAASHAMNSIDVVTTSGISTGRAANYEKVQDMKDAIGDHPLALASGITPENVLEYTLYTDCFLVSTGVSNSPHELNPARVRKLADTLSGI